MRCRSLSIAAKSSGSVALCKRLKDLIPRLRFAVAIPAASGGRIIARETVKVVAERYGAM